MVVEQPTLIQPLARVVWLKAEVVTPTLVAVGVILPLLVAAWHVLTRGEKDKHAEPQRVAQSLMRFVYRTGMRHLPTGMTALEYTRQQLDRLDIGQELTHLVWGNKRFKLPLSSRASPVE